MSHSSVTADTAPPGLPLVVQLSFAGSRVLFDPKQHPHVNPVTFERGVQHLLRERIEKLRTELNLTPRHFWCGISQIAIGGDTVFTRVCQEMHIPQRICLPQPLDDFLAAKSKNGQPDFSNEEQRVARELVESPHIIQVRSVSTANERQARFEAVNRRLARMADVAICLVRADAEAKPGGSLDLVEQGRKRGRPVLELRVSVGPNGQPVFEHPENWHNREWFQLPALPHELAGLETELDGIPPVKPYCDALKVFASTQAKWKQLIFKSSAFTILGTHLIATLCAVLALWWGQPDTAPPLLRAELVLLMIGLGIHEALHWSHASAIWGMSRLAAEVARSVLPLANVKTYLSHLFTLPLPDELLPLLRTLNVLHLRESHQLSAETFEQRRRGYIDKRLLDKRSGQIPYYEDRLTPAERWLTAANWVFRVFSFLAIVASLVKLILHVAPERSMAWISPFAAWWLRHHATLEPEDVSHALGTMAILFPVVAVAALSLAAALDLQARASTYQKTLAFLDRHLKLLEQATSDAEFAELAIEAETSLLGETATWYFRRSYTGVT